MANVKITELTAATALAGTDVLPIVDVGADATKKVSVSDLLRNLPDGTASAPALAFADDQNSGLLSPAENELAFATSGTQRLVIDSSGNVGISTTSPAGKLSVGPDQDIVFGNQASSGTGGTGRLVATGGAVYLQAGVAATSGSNAPLVVTGYGGVGERLRIDSSGRLLVGTSSAPTAGSWAQYSKFTVKG